MSMALKTTRNIDRRFAVVEELPSSHDKLERVTVISDVILKVRP